jgi:hypothetical protein
MKIDTFADIREKYDRGDDLNATIEIGQRQEYRDGITVLYIGKLIFYKPLSLRTSEILGR